MSIRKLINWFFCRRLREDKIIDDPVVDSYNPQTELGKKLISIRRAYVISGGKLLDEEELDAEMQAWQEGEETNPTIKGSKE